MYCMYKVTNNGSFSYSMCYGAMITESFLQVSLPLIGSLYSTDPNFLIIEYWLCWASIISLRHTLLDQEEESRLNLTENATVNPRVVD